MHTITAVSAGGVIIDPGGRVVLTSRRSFAGALQWGLPKGLVEPGETPAVAACREATEETGLTVEIVAALRRIDYWYVEKTTQTRVHKFVHYYLMCTTGGDPAGHDAETEEVALLGAEEALRRASFASERAAIKEALALGPPSLPPSLGPPSLPPSLGPPSLPLSLGPPSLPPGP